MRNKETVLVTGASQGIGAAIVQMFLSCGYRVVATSRSATKTGFEPSPDLAIVDGDIGKAATAENVAQTAVVRFGSIDHVVNNAGIFSVKPFTEFTADEFRGLVSTNLEGFIFITQLAVKQMLAQGTGGSVTTITTSLVENPIAGVSASIPMITKGGLEAITLSLSSEYAKNGIRFNAVAPGVVDTPLHEKFGLTRSIGSRRPSWSVHCNLRGFLRPAQGRGRCLGSVSGYLWHREDIGSGDRRRCEPSARGADRTRCDPRSRFVANEGRGYATP